MIFIKKELMSLKKIKNPQISSVSIINSMKSVIMDNNQVKNKELQKKDANTFKKSFK